MISKGIEVITTRKKGYVGEELALSILQKQNYQLLAKNYRSPYGEIDLIVEKENNCHFFEVKMRNRPLIDYWDLPLSEVQLLRIRKSASHFLSSFQRNKRFKGVFLTFLHIYEDKLTQSYFFKPYQIEIT